MGSRAHFLFPGCIASAAGALQPAAGWRAMAGEQQLYDTIERTVEGLGYEFVDVERLAGGLLRVTLDRDAGREARGLREGEPAVESPVRRRGRGLRPARGVVAGAGPAAEAGARLRPVRRVGSAGAAGRGVPAEGASGRRRLHGRLLEVVGATGSERVRIQLPDDAVPAVRAAAPKGRARATASGWRAGGRRRIRPRQRCKGKAGAGAQLQGRGKEQSE